MADQILVAKHAFIFAQDGIEVPVRKGSTVRVGHPMLEGNEAHFEPFVVDFDVKPSPTKKAGA